MAPECFFQGGRRPPEGGRMTLHEAALVYGRFRVGTEFGLCRVTLPTPRLPGVVCPDAVGFGETFAEAIESAVRVRRGEVVLGSRVIAAARDFCPEGESQGQRWGF